MSHLVQTMAYVGDTPWHGFGQRLSRKQSIDTWAREAGMDWQIVETPVRFLGARTGHLTEIAGFELETAGVLKGGRAR